ncbi:MAG: class I SAM-dependent methyltransferase [Bacteroidota bacterium]
MSKTDASEFSLETLSEAIHYNEFVYDLMCPYLGHRVLELGAGIGNLTPLFLRGGTKVLAIDIDPNLIQIHRERVAEHSDLSVECVSLEDLSRRQDMRGSFDSIVSSNVLEHIPDGTVEEVVRAMHLLLKPGGYAVHWVPAFPAIFGSLDEVFHHCRRYTKASGRTLFESAGFNVASVSYWNMPGFFGWWLYGRILRVQSIPRTSALTFDRFAVPVLRVIEPRLWRPFGQSLLIVARRNAS